MDIVTISTIILEKEATEIKRVRGPTFWIDERIKALSQLRDCITDGNQK